MSYGFDLLISKTHPSLQTLGQFYFITENIKQMFQLVYL